MAHRPRVMVVFGTRPEAIKLAPVVAALRDCVALTTWVVSTGQHRDLAQQIQDEVGLVPDVELKLMRENQSPNEFLASAIRSLDTEMQSWRPDLVLVQGDTASAFGGTMAAFYLRLPVGHVEAGLRTEDVYSPFPEEAQRRLISVLSSLHFAPTARNLGVLLREGVDRDRILVTGNTAIDAVQVISSIPFCEWRQDIAEALTRGGRLILATVHRRENIGGGILGVLRALDRLAEDLADVTVVLQVHPNPQVQSEIAASLAEESRVILVPPLGYTEFIALLSRASLVITDSGGVQEEAPSLGVPVLITRDETERVEGVESGASVLVGTNPSVIVSRARSYLDGYLDPQAQGLLPSPYGDGSASRRIVEGILWHFGLGERPLEFK